MRSNLKMEYQVLSRKYRPQKFDQIIGQSHIIDTLINSIKLNRIAHGYLLSGIRGSGKTTVARVFSKTLNCLSDNKPCNKCQNCQEIKESRSLDVIELDGASNRGIDEIREIKETVKYPPVSSAYKIFIIDEVHMLTKEAFNALLKTLEEPPNNVIFILATTDSHKIPDTILSRVLRFDFKKIITSKISNHMKNILDKENIEYEQVALDTISYKADGSIRDALSMLDKIISYSSSNISYALVKESLGIIEDEVYLKLFHYILKHDENKLLYEIKVVIDSGYSIDNFISGFNVFLSQSLVFLSGYKKNEIINNKTKKWLEKNGKCITNKLVMNIIDKIQEYELKAKYLLQPDIALESLFINLASLNKDSNYTGELTEEDKVDSNNDTKDSKELIKDKDSDKVEQIEEKKIDMEVSIGDNNLEQFDVIKNWDKVIAVIDQKDARISSFLEDVKLEFNDDILIIELGDSGNDFIEKTLNNNISIINSSIERLANKKIEIKIEMDSKKKQKNNEQDHPLLESIKEKFGGDTIR